MNTSPRTLEEHVDMLIDQWAGSPAWRAKHIGGDAGAPYQYALEGLHEVLGAHRAHFPDFGAPLNFDPAWMPRPDSPTMQWAVTGTNGRSAILSNIPGPHHSWVTDLRIISDRKVARTLDLPVAQVVSLREHMTTAMLRAQWAHTQVLQAVMSPMPPPRITHPATGQPALGAWQPETTSVTRTAYGDQVRRDTAQSLADEWGRTDWEGAEYFSLRGHVANRLESRIWRAIESAVEHGFPYRHIREEALDVHGGRGVMELPIKSDLTGKKVRLRADESVANWTDALGQPISDRQAAWSLGTTTTVTRLLREHLAEPLSDIQCIAAYASDHMRGVEADATVRQPAATTTHAPSTPSTSPTPAATRTLAALPRGINKLPSTPSVSSPVPRPAAPSGPLI